MTIKQNEELKVAWLLPVAWYYWHPTLSEFTKIFPHTKIFTALFPGFAQGFEDSLDVELIGEFKVVGIEQQAKGYGSNFTYLSPTIIKPLIKFRPDLIIASSFGIWTILALLLKFIFRWQVIIAYEGSSPSVDYLHSHFRIFLRKIMIKLADGCITNTQRGAKYLIEALSANQKTVLAHPYEIPSAKSLVTESEFDNSCFTQLSKPIFLFVGRLIPHKGVDIILQACKILQQENQQNYTVLIVGDGEEKAELEQYCQENNLTQNIKWLGRVDYSLIAQYYQQADVFILPTWEDTWGVVTSEVMLFGKPVLCSIYAGSCELIEEGINGYVFDPNHPQKLANLMAKFISNPDLIKSMGQKSQAKMNIYTPQSAANSLSQFITLTN